MMIFTMLMMLILIPEPSFVDSTKQNTDSEKPYLLIIDTINKKEKPKWDLSNYPNPFNPSTVITFRLNAESKVTLNVYNVLGQLIQNLANERLPAGEHKVTFNADEISGGLMSGVYLYRIEAWADDGTNFTAIRKMIFTK